MLNLLKRSESGAVLTRAQHDANFDAIETEVNKALVFSISVYLQPTPLASEVLVRIPVASALTFPSALTGSMALASTAASAQSVFSLQKNGAQFGTCTFAAGSIAGVFAAPAQSDFAVGDVFSIVAPSSADATLSGVGLSVVGVRT